MYIKIKISIDKFDFLVYNYALLKKVKMYTIGKFAKKLLPQLEIKQENRINIGYVRVSAN